MKINTQPYKGARDFYPEDKRTQNYIFSVMRKVAEKFGYEEYDAPLLEETALYAAKSGEEIVNEQTYSFTDRGGREVSIRPEMTPTLARMVAQRRKQLVYPIRWYSIPNLWRYEKPQRGRVREHWQLNVDIYGATGVSADFEVISLAVEIMKGFGATKEMFYVRVNSRRLLDEFFSNILQADKETARRLSKIIDKKEKLSEKEFVSLLAEILPKEGQKKTLLFLKAKNVSEVKKIDKRFLGSEAIKELEEFFGFIASSPSKDFVVFDPTIVRGFDYYTGIVFEIFDLSPENNRSLFGGGRYDDLLSIFGVENLSGFGFGMGDVAIKDFLTTHKLLPSLDFRDAVYVTVFDSGTRTCSNGITERLRRIGIKTAIELQDMRLDKQLKYADRNKFRYAVIAGPEEQKEGKAIVKDLKTGEQMKMNLGKLESYLQSLFVSS